MSHLGDLWDLIGVDGPAVLGHGHSVPGLFSRRALLSLLSLLSGIYRTRETHPQHEQGKHDVMKIAALEKI